MIDKSLVKKRFERSLKTYNDNAVIQKKMAEKLVDLLPRNNYNSVLEIGTSSGILTQKIANLISFQKYTANDIVEKSKEYIDKIIPENTFLKGDIEEIILSENYDLIISNAALQWCNNTEKTIEKLKKNLNKNGVLAVSIFGNENYKEIKTLLNIENRMNTEIEGLKETYTLYFNSPIEVLKHIKATGANALTEFKFTKTSLKTFETEYKKLFAAENKVSLTYQPLYIILTGN